MRIRDWSSDVCSSDHLAGRGADMLGAPLLARMGAGKRVDFTLAPFDADFLLKLLGRHRAYDLVGVYDADSLAWLMRRIEAKARGRPLARHTVTDGTQPLGVFARSEERRVGPACVITCRSRGSRIH